MKVGPLLLPVKLFNRIQQPLAQEQEVCQPDKKKKGKDHGPTKTLIMVVLLTCEGLRVRAALTTYVDPHVLELAKEEAKRAFMAIAKEAEEGMQEGKGECQTVLKVYKEERADKAAPARFSCETAWARKNETEETDIAAWYFSPEAHDVVSRFQTAWARKDTQDIIAWIFPPGENETSKSQAAGTAAGGKKTAGQMKKGSQQ